MEIVWLKHEKIDKEKYDNCILNSCNGTIYAMSWYLDATNPQWQLLMAEDYRHVMPLPVKRKYGIKYMMQPLFTQQLGVFSEWLAADVVKSFVSAIPYRFYQLQLNVGNVFNSFVTRKRVNFVLHLNKSYSSIQRGYKKNFIRNLRKSEKENLQIERDIDLEIFWDLIKNNAEKRPVIQLLNTFENVICRIKENTRTEIWSVRNSNGSLLASTLFLYWKNRIYYMLSVSTQEGKQKQAMTFLLDKLIETNADNDIVLDFEGSSLPGIARYYESTGASLEHYPVLCKPKILFDAVIFLKNKFK
jgi:hypothetical protein